MLRLLSEAPFDITGLEFLCIDKAIESSDPYRYFEKLRFEQMTQPEVLRYFTQQLETLRKRVYGRFFGLLEMSSSIVGKELFLHGSVVQFTHRTIKDFLETTDARTILGDHFTEFDWFSAWCTATKCFTWVCTRSSPMDTICKAPESTSCPAEHLRWKQLPNFAFQESINRLVGELGAISWSQYRCITPQVEHVVEHAITLLREQFPLQDWDTHFCSAPSECSVLVFPCSCELVWHFSAARCMVKITHCEYFERLPRAERQSLFNRQRGPFFVRDLIDWLRRLGYNGNFPFELTIRNRKFLELLKMLFEAGIGPNTAVLRTGPYHETAYIPAFGYLLSYLMEITASTSGMTVIRFDLPFVSNLINIFIESGADTRIWFTVMRYPQEPLGVEMDENQHHGSNGPWTFQVCTPIEELCPMSLDSVHFRRMGCLETDFPKRPYTLLEVLCCLNVDLTAESLKSLWEGHAAIRQEQARHGIIRPIGLSDSLLLLVHAKDLLADREEEINAMELSGRDWPPWPKDARLRAWAFLWNRDGRVLAIDSVPLETIEEILDPQDMGFSFMHDASNWGQTVVTP